METTAKDPAYAAGTLAVVSLMLDRGFGANNATSLTGKGVK